MSAARVKECLYGGHQGCIPRELDLICQTQAHHLTRKEKILGEPNQSPSVSRHRRRPLGIYFKDTQLQEWGKGQGKAEIGASDIYCTMSSLQARHGHGPPHFSSIPQAQTENHQVTILRVSRALPRGQT